MADKKDKDKVISESNAYMTFENGGANRNEAIKTF